MIKYKINKCDPKTIHIIKIHQIFNSNNNENNINCNKPIQFYHFIQPHLSFTHFNSYKHLTQSIILFNQNSTHTTKTINFLKCKTENKNRNSLTVLFN